jgi:hypothetical protein
LPEEAPCLKEVNTTFYAAIMEAFLMRLHHNSNFIRPFPQRLSTILQPVGSSLNIENTYPQLL